MIDGVKLLCNLNPDHWTNNKNLSFRSWTDTQTGEIPNNNKHADINGLHLSIITGEKEMFCNVRGSLPKYYLNGTTNAKDYHFTDFLTTVKLLNENLKICPEKAVLRGFEFGVNINLAFDVASLLECIKSYKMHTFGTYELGGFNVGIYFDFQQYRIKIYDKEKQQTGKNSRLMRIEIAVKKMNWVKHLNIKTLSDLQNASVWAELSKILGSVWNDLIFIDKSLQYRLMTNHQQKKYLRYFDFSYWCNLNQKAYNKAKHDLNRLQSIYQGQTNTKQIIHNLIAEKCQKLATGNPGKNGADLTEILTDKNTSENSEKLQPLKNQNWGGFNHLDKGIKPGIISSNSLTEIYPKKIRQNNNPNSNKKKAKKSTCMNCKKSIEEKKKGAKFCGLKCKNQHNGKLRTEARQRKRQKEQNQIAKIIKALPKTDLSLLIIYRASDGLQYADHLQQSEINAPPEWIKQIRKILITDNKTAPPIEFTTLRAKKLIKEISILNAKSCIK